MKSFAMLVGILFLVPAFGAQNPAALGSRIATAAKQQVGMTKEYNSRYLPAMKTRKSWREKLADSKGLPKIGRVEVAMTKRWGNGTMVIPAPLDVDEVMKKVPRGKLTTINELRSALARKHHVAIACPITTGIFAWIAAHAAEEDAAAGRKRITPYWRTLKTGGELNQKYPGGIAALKKRLRLEGHAVVKKGKRYLVKGFEKNLVQL
jgi:hypothetical protein